MAGLLIALLAGCSGVPDRSVDADGVTAALRSLPGVASVEAGYTNAATRGQSYNVTLTVAADIDREQLIAIAQAYDRQIDAVGFEKHTLRFSVIRGGDRMNSFRGRLTRAPITQIAARWFDLAEQLAEPVERTTTDDLDLIKVSTDDVASLVERIRVGADDLGSAHWLVRSERARIDLESGYPDRATAALITELIADGGQWNISYEPTATPALEYAVWLEQSQELEPTARAHLARIAALETVATYRLKPSGKTPLTVIVHGCHAGGPPIEQELNREFGNC